MQYYLEIIQLTIKRLFLHLLISHIYKVYNKVTIITIIKTIIITIITLLLMLLLICYFIIKL